MTKAGQKLYKKVEVARGETEVDRVGCEISASLKKAFKAKAASEGYTIKEVLRQLIERYVDGKLPL